MVRDLFRDKEQTEFIIATIPTVLGINESRRLLKALREDEIPCNRIIINQACDCLGRDWFFVTFFPVQVCFRQPSCIFAIAVNALL